MSKKKEDLINQPSHYTKGRIQPIEFIVSNNMGHCEGCIVKYVTRYKFKNNPIQDLKKAKFYLEYLLKELEKNDHT